MAISPINPAVVEDAWQASQPARQQMAAQQSTVLQEIAVSALSGAAGAGVAGNAAHSGKNAAGDTLGRKGQDGAAFQGKQVNQALASINHTFDALSIGVQFEIDHDYKSPIIKVVDKESGDVIRQIPSEVMVRMAKEFDKLKGLLVEQTA